MILNATELLQDLRARTQMHLEQAEKLTALSTEQLNYKVNKESWSILECLEHLNLYGDFYIPELKHRIESSRTTAVAHFKSGYLGNYFANMMLPKGKPNKMKTFKVMNPIGSTLNPYTISRFIAQQEQIIILLDKAQSIDLNKTKTAISISKFIKLKIGDTFRVVIYHNERHMAQANKLVV